MLLVNGATHGDEYEGPTLLRTWAERWRPRRLAGTVVFVPVLNEAAFFAGQRCAPVDGANLARVFPGKANGSPTERLAHLFDTQLLAQCTHYADLHSAGAAYHLKPWTGYVTHRGAINRTQRAMAACFDTTRIATIIRRIAIFNPIGIMTNYIWHRCSRLGGVKTYGGRIIYRNHNLNISRRNAFRYRHCHKFVETKLNWLSRS